MGRYRGRLEIIADVLGVVRVGAKKTQIMYQANLSYELLNRYLKDVIETGLVETKDGNIYELTKKGSDFLREFKDYHQRRVEVEEQAGEVQEEKMTLQDKFLNSAGVNAALKNCLSEKVKRRE